MPSILTGFAQPLSHDSDDSPASHWSSLSLTSSETKSFSLQQKCTLVWPSCSRDLKSSVILWSPLLRWTGQVSLDLSRWDWLNYFRISEICELWFVFWWVSPIARDPPDTIIRAMTWGRRRREMRLERKSATKRHLIQDGRSGSHATLTTELSHYRMSKIISSVHPGMIDKADSKGPWPWPITNLFLAHVITIHQSDV